MPATEPLDVLVVYVPRDATERLLAALFAAGAGTVGDYEECAFVAPGMGRFRPVGSASPAVGRLGELEQVAEDRVEVVLPRRLRADVVAAMRTAHPYEEPAFHVLTTAEVPLPDPTGSARPRLSPGAPG
jgi:hypothetical protein